MVPSMSAAGNPQCKSTPKKDDPTISIGSMNGRADRRPDPTPINKFGIVAPVGRNDVEEHANSPVYRPANDISHPARRVLDIPRRASFPSFFPGASPSFSPASVVPQGYERTDEARQQDARSCCGDQVNGPGGCPSDVRRHRDHVKPSPRSHLRSLAQ